MGKRRLCVQSNMHKEIKMGKTHRGKGLAAEYPNKARGLCPICGRTGVKLLYEVKTGETKMKVCKLCRKRTPVQAG